jgi:hypothetical protein
MMKADAHSFALITALQVHKFDMMFKWYPFLEIPDSRLEITVPCEAD